VIVHADPTTRDVLADRAVDALEALEALDALLPGLGDTVVDLLDAIGDRTDDTAPEALVGLARRLTAVWAGTPVTERPLVVLDAVRCAMSSRPRAAADAP
jgi:hypothetical protein